MKQSLEEKQATMAADAATMKSLGLYFDYANMTLPEVVQAYLKENEIKNFVKNITDEDFILNENEYQDENITNEENYDKTYKKTYNNSYWRAEKGRVYFTIDYNFVKANDEWYSSENYYTGNYFKTLEIAKKVLNSDVWKNRFWDYRKNKNIRRSDVYYTIDFLLGEPTISTELNIAFN